MINDEANTVAYHFVTQFVCLHGLPKSLVTDCGTEFLSHVFKEVCQLLKIKQTSTTPYQLVYGNEITIPHSFTCNVQAIVNCR